MPRDGQLQEETSNQDDSDDDLGQIDGGHG